MTDHGMAHNSTSTAISTISSVISSTISSATNSTAGSVLKTISSLPQRVRFDIQSAFNQCSIRIIAILLVQWAFISSSITLNEQDTPYRDISGCAIPSLSDWEPVRGTVPGHCWNRRYSLHPASADPVISGNAVCFEIVSRSMVGNVERQIVLGFWKYMSRQHRLIFKVFSC